MKPSLTIAQVRKEVRAELRKPERPGPSRANIDAATSAVTKAMEKSIRKAQFALVPASRQSPEKGTNAMSIELEELLKKEPKNITDIFDAFFLLTRLSTEADHDIAHDVAIRILNVLPEKLPAAVIAHALFIVVSTVVDVLSKRRMRADPKPTLVN